VRLLEVWVGVGETGGGWVRLGEVGWGWVRLVEGWVGLGETGGCWVGVGETGGGCTPVVRRPTGEAASYRSPTFSCGVQESVMLQFCGNKLDKKDFFGKSDPFLVFYRSNEDGS